MAVFFSRFPRTARGEGETLEATEARQGRWGRHVFWVLVISTILAVAALFGSWAFHSGDLGAAPEQGRNSATYAETQASGGHEASPKQREGEQQPPRQ